MKTLTFRNSATNVETEAQGLVDFFGGDFTENTPYESCFTYFLNREIPELEWSLVYDAAVNLVNA